MPPNFESLVGGQLGQFEIKGELGRGGMAVVYKGYQASLDRWVAIKTLPQEFAGKREMVSRFHREAEAMVSLNHSNIVQIIDKGEDKGLYYFAMEFVDGPSLQQILKESRSKELMFDIAEQVAAGLDYAHKKGIVHRDIKPGNVLWETATSLAKIADFGIARLTQKPEEMITLTATNVGMGTMNYMAPEQKTDAANVDHRADIYSLGVMIYEMFTGTLPMGRFKLPSALDSSLPRKLDEIVTRCMEPDPADRYASMAELQTDLNVARHQAGNDGTLVRSVRDAAERTLTAIAGEEHKGKAGFACCLFILMGLTVGGYVAYSKKWIPGLEPEVADTKTKKTKKTRRSSSSGDDDDDDSSEKTPDKTPEKTGEDPPEKTEDPPEKTPEKTEDPPEKTGKTEDPPEKTGKTEDPPEKTGKTEDPPEKTGKTEDPPSKTKTGGGENPPKNGNGGTKPEVVKLDPATQREYSGLQDQLKLLIAEAKKEQKTWSLTSRKLERQVKSAEADLNMKASRKAVATLRDTTIPKLQGSLAAALDRQIRNSIQEALAQRPELKQATNKAERDRRNATANAPASRIRACVAILAQLARERALAEQKRAEAALAVAKMRVGSQKLQQGVSTLGVARAALTQNKPEEARSKFSAAFDAFLKAAPPSPRRALYRFSAFPKSITNKKTEQFGAIAPAPGGRIFAVAKEGSSSTLYLLGVSGSTLRQEWYARLPNNTFAVASEGADANRNYTVWVGTQQSRDNQITQLRFDEDGNPLGQGKVISVGEWVHDMVVGDDGQLYVLFDDRIEVFFLGRRVGRREYDQSGFSRLPIHPRRLAVLSDGRAVVSGVVGNGQRIGLEVGKGFKLGWPGIELRTVYIPGGQKGKITTRRRPLAITGFGSTLLAHDHGHLASARTRRHLIAFPQGENGFLLTREVKDAERPMLSTDMAYSNGSLFVLDHPKQLIKGNLLGRGRIMVYSIRSK